MKKILSLTLLCALAASVVHASNFTENNTDKAKAIIDAAIDAHGGDALLENLNTLIIEHRTTNYSVGQSRGTDAPWDKAVADGLDAIDLESSAFVTQNKGSGGGYDNHNATVINGDQSYQLDYRAGTSALIGEPDYDTASGPFVRVTPALLLRTLKDREANAHFLGETNADGVDYNVIGFSMLVGPAISLYFEKDSNLLRRSERVFPGFGLVEYRFDDYTEGDGVLYNQSFTLYLNGDVNLERKNKSARINEPLDELLEVPATLVSVPEVQADPLTRQELDEGVWLIGGNGTYAMFVDMGDYIFAAGGTAGIPDRIDSLREVVGDKPIRYGMMTHHHFDHVVGVPAYEEEGATLIAAASHARIIREAATDGEQLELKLVDEKMKLEANGRSIEIVDVGPTAHTEHLLVAWLPKEGILFEADHFTMPRQGPVPPAARATRTFAESLAQQGLKVKRFVSAHSPTPGTRENLEEALSRDELQVFQPTP